jgi:hypothetical protein
LRLTDDQLTELAIEGVAKDSTVDMEHLTVNVQPQGIQIAALVRLTSVDREFDLETALVPMLLNGRVRFEVSQLEIKNYPPLLSRLVAPLVTDVLSQKLDLFDQLQQGGAGARGFEITKLELQEGAILIEGVTN